MHDKMCLSFTFVGVDLPAFGGSRTQHQGSGGAGFA